MIQELGRQLVLNGFLPHGYCISWSPPLLATYVVSDALIALSYFSMPIAMGYFATRRKDFPYKWLIWMFAAFILSCGTTHLLGTIILWRPIYWIDAALKAVTAGVSLATAVALWPLIPRALKIPGRGRMQAINDALRLEIGERRRMEDELRRANAELERLHRQKDASLTDALYRLDAHMGNSPLAIVEFGPDFRVTRWSDSAEQLFGWRADEIIGKSIAELRWVHDQDADEVAKISAAMLAGASSRNMHANRNYRKDGAVLHCEWYNSAIYDGRGRLVSILSQVLDVTEQKRTSAALKASETRFRATFEQAAVGMAHLAEDGRWLQVNDRLCAMLGYGREAMLGMTQADLSPSPEHEAERLPVRRLLAGDIPSYSQEKRYVRRDGSLLWVKMTVSLVRQADGQADYFIAVIEDIAPYKEALEEIGRLNADLERRVEERTAELSAANRELDNFAHAVTHDLRAPLRAMNGFSHLLEENHAGRMDEEAARCIHQIRQASRKMGDLIDGILTLSRITRGQLRRDRIDLSAMAGHQLADLAAAEPGRRVSWEVEPGLLAYGDACMLQSVISNLLDNAWKYTARTPAARIRVYRDGDWICVADNGAGFDPEHAAKLFQPFQRLHSQSEFPGMGIGLATVHRIIQRHGGEIAASAAPGRGATFRFRLGPGRD